MRLKSNKKNFNRESLPFKKCFSKFAEQKSEAARFYYYGQTGRIELPFAREALNVEFIAPEDKAIVSFG